jgi:anionic cell wall polymer biosynthesis LytR-Cps2A-Psr (LCP) family protein
LRISKTGASRLLLGLIIVLIILGIAAAVYTLRSNPIEDALSANRVINILFVIEEEKSPLSTYVLMYYPATRRAAIFDIPGDLGLLITRINRVDRIDRVYDSARIGNYENEIGKLLGIEINFSIVFTKENLVSLVDLLEGMEIFIPSPVSYRDDDTLVLFPSGITILDGDKAAVYASYSLPEEDSEMIVFRRQRFFLGLLDRIVNMNDSLKNPDAAKLYYSFFKTGMNRSTLARLLDEFVSLDVYRANIQSVTGNLREVSGQMLIIPHWDGSLVKEVVRQTLGSLTRQTEGSGQRTPTVEILNGTAVTGLAGRTAEMLRSFGYDIISVGNADRNDYESTAIIHRSGDDSIAKAFADVITCTNIKNEFVPDEEPEDSMDIHPLDYKADITLIIGRDFNGRNVIKN